VIARWADDTALLRLDDGSTREVPMPEEIRDRIDVGTRATVAAGAEPRVEWDLTSEADPGAAGRAAPGRARP